jgi:hypothetical protein
MKYVDPSGHFIVLGIVFAIVAGFIGLVWPQVWGTKRNLEGARRGFIIGLQVGGQIPELIGIPDGNDEPEGVEPQETAQKSATDNEVYDRVNPDYTGLYADASSRPYPTPGTVFKDGSVILRSPNGGRLYQVREGDAILYGGDRGHVAIVGEIPRGSTSTNEILVWELTSKSGWLSSPARTTYLNFDQVRDIRTPNDPIPALPPIHPPEKTWWSGWYNPGGGIPDYAPGMNCTEYAIRFYRENKIRPPDYNWYIGVQPSDFNNWGRSTRIGR